MTHLSLWWVPFSKYPIKCLCSITYFWNLEGYCIALAKLIRKIIPTSFYDNIINHQIKNCLLIHIPCSLYHVKHIDPNKWRYCKDLHIDGKRLNKFTKFKCNSYIILGYLHSPWNLEGYWIALPKPKSHTISTPYCDNILNHDTNEGIVKLITLMVKGNENITKMKVLQLHFKIFFKH
jgi:hypothetical protein